MGFVRGPKYLLLQALLDSEQLPYLPALVSGESGGGAGVKRTGETSDRQRIRQLGEKAPQRSQHDGRLSLLSILTDRQVGPA